MLEINNETLLGQVVDEAIAAAEQNSRSELIRASWVRAIVKAANLIRTGDLSYWAFDADRGELVLLSRSNNAYTANGTCECRAYRDFHNPCWHRAAARLLVRYFAQVEKPVDDKTEELNDRAN